MAVKKLEVPLVGEVNEDEARIALAAELYSEGKMTLKQAANTAQLTLWDFLYELGKRKISYTNIAVDDLQEELGKIGEGAHAFG
jgi:predicted HTH domain antitoxin